jgi:hypothetical protein
MLSGLESVGAGGQGPQWAVEAVEDKEQQFVFEKF